jgi:hypothetical protein
MSEHASTARIDANGPVPVTRLPTRVDATCKACGHAGTALVAVLGDIHKLRCGKCGRAGATVAARVIHRRRSRSRNS